MFKIRLIYFLFFLTTTIAWAVIPVADNLTSKEIFQLNYDIGQSFDLSVKQWKIKQGDDIAWTQPSYDDSSWSSIEVGRALNVQGYSSGIYWYRVKFNISDNFAGKTLQLDLGEISFYDRTFVNGIEVGTYGQEVDGSAVYGSTVVHRRYLLDPSLLNFEGENVIAVRVQTGYLSGLYSGPYKISQVLNDFDVYCRLKGQSRNSPSHFLSNSEYLNVYTGEDSVLIYPELVKTGIAEVNESQIVYDFVVEVLDEDENIIFNELQNCKIEYLKWTKFNPISLGSFGNGNYSCVLSLSKQGSLVWKKTIAFSKRDKTILTMPVDMSLNLKDANRPRDIHNEAMGHFGPRFVDDTNSLVDKLDVGDSRASLTFSSLVANYEKFPLIFMSNLKPSPIKLQPDSYFLQASGNQYDGIPDGWVLGFVTGRKNLVKTDLKIIKSNWAERVAKYTYSNGTYLEFSQNTLSPAYHVKTTSDQVRAFGSIGSWGIGLPTKLAYISGTVPQVIDSSNIINGQNMAQNWILAWFNGGANWDEFDMPWLFVMEKKPSWIQNIDGALTFQFDGQAGHFWGMPLFGVKVVSLDATDLWSTDLPSDVLEKCNFWSRAVLKYPVGVERFFDVNRTNNSLTIKDKFQYVSTEDAWLTEPIEVAPVSPTIVLAENYGDVDMTLNKQIFDCSLTTLYGPYSVIMDSNEYVLKISNIVNYVNDVRDVRWDNNDPVITGIENTISLRAESYYASGELTIHPWNTAFSGQRFHCGHSEPTLTNFLLSMPHMNSSIRSKFENEIKREVETYFLWSGIADSNFAYKINPYWRDKPVLITTSNPLNGLQLTTSPELAAGYAIDSLNWESQRLYSLWHYAYYFDRWQFIEDNWEFIKTFFNLIPNSHDWATSVSWDTFSGLRVGNGLQESGTIHAAACAMARMARKLGYTDIADYASYFAVMQLVGMNAAVSSIDYFRENRLWLASHSEAAEIEEVETSLKKRYMEFNENAGFSQNIINGLLFATETDSFIMTPLPEVMRLYKEIWPQETDHFFSPKDIFLDVATSKPPYVDIYSYMIPDGNETVMQQVMSRRETVSRTVKEEMTDWRAYLDFKSQIGYISIRGELKTEVYRYNMGPATVVAGYTDILDTPYNFSDGYGWTYRLVSGSLDKYNALFRTRGANFDALLDTVILENRPPFGGLAATDSRAFTLRFDLPNGLYTVSIRSGDEFVKSDSTFVIGDSITQSSYGDFLSLDDSNSITFDSGILLAGEHIKVTSKKFKVTNNCLYVGWGRRLGTVEWGTINDIVISRDPECQDVVGSGYRLSGDFNSDCFVNFDDIVYLAENWLQLLL